MAPAAGHLIYSEIRPDKKLNISDGIDIIFYITCNEVSFSLRSYADKN